MKFGPREILFVVLLVAMPVAAYFYVFQPRTETIEDARAEILRMQGKLDQLEQATRDMPDLGLEIEKLSRAVEIQEERLPKREEVDGILDDVWRLAVANRLESLSVRPQQVIATASYSEQPILMKIRGDFDGFYQFLLDVEQLPRITRLPDIRLTKIQSETAEGQMTAEIRLSIFFEGEQSRSSSSSKKSGGKA